MAHAWAQVAQLLLSVVVSTHVELHSICPVGHVTAAVQVPVVQVWPVAHAWPHEPQFAVSVPVLTHVPPQSACPVGHVIAAQVPALQASVDAQA